MVVYIVGAGPGDPELITVRAVRLIRKAEVVIYDKLVNENVLSNLSPDCERIFVGKRLKGAKGSQDMQRRINDLLIEHGKDKLVVRLKGGDPFIFGRGGEEAEILAKAGIPFEIVPGIPSPVAVPAYAGIPVTHRDHNSAVAFITGHEMKRDAPRIDWKRMPDTLVVLMGARNMPNIATQLIESGRDPDTPVAAIRHGTLAHQDVQVTTLKKARRRKFKAPTIFVIGTVAGLNRELSWYQGKMSVLEGKKVALTRTKGHVKESMKMLKALGADVINVPLISLRRRRFKLPEIRRFDTIVFTSVEGIKAVADKVNIKRWKKKRFFSIGPKTQQLLATYGINSEIPDDYNSQGLADHMLKRLRGRAKVLMLRSSAASPLLKKVLSKVHDVIEVPLYDVRQLEPDLAKLRKADVIMLASSSCAKAYLKVASKIRGRLIVSIGPMTSQPLKERNMDFIEAEEHTMEGMVRATLDHLWARTNTAKK